MLADVNVFMTDLCREPCALHIFQRCFPTPASAKVKATYDLTCFRRGVPFYRGRFEPQPSVTQCSGVVEGTGVKIRNGTGP